MEINYQETLENLLHELSRLNSIMKASAEAISKGLKGNIDKVTLSHHSEQIIESSFLFSTHIDIVNYQLNPDFFEIEKASKRSLFGKFYKAILSYKRIAKQKDVTINYVGEANALIDSYPVIDTLPILILDNAVKYSPRDGEICIDFYEDSDSIEIQICNMGPHVAPNERQKIFNRGYRGKEAIKTNVLGLGFGMSFIKHICDIHKAKIKLTCSDNTISIGEIKYSEFILTVIFPKTI